MNPLKEKSVLEEITWRLDKLENDTLPQVDLNVTEVSTIMWTTQSYSFGHINLQIE